MDTENRLRIVAVSSRRYGGNDRAVVDSLMRQDHTVEVVSPDDFWPPGWTSMPLRVVRRLSRKNLVVQFNKTLIRTMKQMAPDLLYVFKGELLLPETLHTARSLGITSINYFPDTGFEDHGPHLINTIPLYDWFFSTKSNHPGEIQQRFGTNNSSVMLHAYDPSIHRHWTLSDADRKVYECDLAFIGNWSERKSELLDQVCRGCRNLKIKIWGPKRWLEDRRVASYYAGRPIWGPEYAKAIMCSKINLALLFEGGNSARRGDLTTARTFEIPACGGFMLHEENDELRSIFEDHECATFRDYADLEKKIHYYIRNPELRKKISEAGRKKVLSSEHSSDNRARKIVSQYYKLNHRS